MRNLFSKYLNKLMVAAGLAVTVVGFQNCSNARFIAGSGYLDLKSSGAGVAGSTDISDNPKIAYSGPCAIFKGVGMPLVIPETAQDVTLVSQAGALDVELAKSVDIQNMAGHLMVKAAQNVVRISNSSGGLQVNANEITLIENIAGAVCIHALKVGKISTTAGGTKVIASEIDEISNTSGRIHVYGGLIRTVTNNAGGICLHDGARVLSYTNVSGFVGVCP